LAMQEKVDYTGKEEKLFEYSFMKQNKMHIDMQMTAIAFHKESQSTIARPLSGLKSSELRKFSPISP